MSWEDNKNHIVSQVEAGTANQGMQEWYAKWVANGMPSTKEGMLSSSQTEQTQNSGGASNDKPAGVSSYLWERVKSGSLNYNLTSIINQPDVRDAIVEAGYGDYVKAVHEKAMDDRAAHYMSNGSSEGDAWNTAQYDWYNQQYGSYGNPTVSESSANDLGFGGGSEVSNEDYNNLPENTAGNVYNQSWMQTDDWSSLSDWERNAKHIVNQINSGKANENQRAWYDTWMEAGSPETKAELQSWKTNQANGTSQTPPNQPPNQMPNQNPFDTQGGGPVRNNNFQTVDYSTQGPATAGVNTGIGTAGEFSSTPWADAYLRTQGNNSALGNAPTGATGGGGGRPMNPYMADNNPEKGFMPMPAGGGASHGWGGSLSPGVISNGGNTPRPNYQPDPRPSTPFADSYMRAQQAATKQGPISGLFSREMENS